MLSVIMVCTAASGTLALMALKSSKYVDVSSVSVIAQATGCPKIILMSYMYTLIYIHAYTLINLCMWW